jgi:hypothetical protein
MSSPIVKVGDYVRWTNYPTLMKVTDVSRNGYVSAVDPKDPRSMAAGPMKYWSFSNMDKDIPVTEIGEDTVIADICRDIRLLEQADHWGPSEFIRYDRLYLALVEATNRLK